MEERGCSSEDLKAAQKLQQELSSIVQDGISQQPLRQLIQETKTFLQARPGSLHKDLQSFSRMLSYLCEVKASLRSKTSEVDNLKDELTRLKEEKASLWKQVADLEESRRYEREKALAVETSLHDHCTQSIEVYKTTLQLYNKVAAENAELMLKLSSLLTSSKQAEKRHSGSLTSSPASDLTFLSPAVDEKVLRRVGIQDLNMSYLISPLFQFKSLPSIAGSNLPLPDLQEDEEDGEDTDDDEEDDKEITTPDSVHHPTQLLDSKEPLRGPQVLPIPPPRPVTKVAHEPSGLSRTAPYREHYGRARSRSNPSHPTSRSQSRSQSPFGSNKSSTPPRTPPPRSNIISAQSQVSYQASSRESLSSLSATMPQQALRSRLQAGNVRGSGGSPSRTDSSVSNNKTPIPVQHFPNDHFSQLLASGSQAGGKPGPSVSLIPPPQTFNGGPTRISTASAVAKKLEEECRQKREERSQIQTQEQLHHDKYHNDDNRDYWSKLSTSPASAAATLSASSSSASQAMRRGQQGYVNPLNPNSSSSSGLKGGLSFSGRSGPYGSEFGRSCDSYEGHNEEQ